MTRFTMVKIWQKLATVEEQEILARACGTSKAYLHQLAGGFRTPGPELAMKIADQTELMHKASNGRLPVLYLTDLVPACASCKYAQKCLGADAVRAEFEIVTPEMLAEQADSEGGEND